MAVMKRNLILLIGLVITLSVILLFRNNVLGRTDTGKTDSSNLTEMHDTAIDPGSPLSIASLRAGSYPGSEIVIEETLPPGSNYDRYIASYMSEGNKIYALLTVPQGDPSAGSGQGVPKSGYPVIVFNHGFIPPVEYRTTERYIAYTDAFSRNGYIVFRSDYRGHGSSEGEASGGYGSNAYTIDVLNALASLKKYKNADPDRIGMWGHSMGGHITLRNMVTNKDVKAGVIWGGVVASYPDLINNWRRGVTGTPPPLPSGARRWRQVLVEEFGEPSEDSPFWQSISSNAFLQDISGPIQLHHGGADHSVPPGFSRKLAQQLKSAGKTVEQYEYPGDDHDISGNFDTAMQRSVEFFDKYLKGGK
jgi:uncharacterized protein